MAAWVMDSPIGKLTLTADDQAITRLDFGAVAKEPVQETPLLKEAQRQLDAYFRGELHTFTVPLRPSGTPFQQQVWQALQGIPYGQTTSYGALAAHIGNPKAMRAVGMANNRNPLSILIPCHRVVGKNGSLVGYGGGLPIKEHLLALEKRHG